jgi:hypothetical protein
VGAAVKPGPLGGDFLPPEEIAAPVTDLVGDVGRKREFAGGKNRASELPFR